jgi:hypothetical protein
MTDAEFVLQQLRDHPAGRDAMQVISASIRERDIGLTVHSRVADLRAQGYTITCGIEGKTRRGRDRYLYRLVGEPAPAPLPAAAPTPAPATPKPHEQLALLA